MPAQSDQPEKPPDPLLEAVTAHNGNVYWAMQSIARRVETNASGEITLFFIKYTVKVGNDGFKEIGKLVAEYGCHQLRNHQRRRPQPRGSQHLQELILDITELGDDSLCYVPSCIP